MVSTTGKRALAVETSGAPDGFPVFLLHGMPGSRVGPKPRSIVLYRWGLRLICYDRPGYGRSDPHPGRTVRDAADDVIAIADDLGVDRFAVVGRSGGGPHALACMAEHPDRVSHGAVMVSLAPSDAGDLDWPGGMNDYNRLGYAAVEHDQDGLLNDIMKLAEEVRRDPSALIHRLEAGMCAADHRVVGDPVLRRLLVDAYREAMRQGPDGWVDDVVALGGPWGFDPAAIRAPLRLWHGADDSFSPLNHARWLAGRIPHADVHIDKDLGHFSAVEVLPRILAWVAKEAAHPQVVPIDARPGTVPVRTDRAGRSPGTTTFQPAAV